MLHITAYQMSTVKGINRKSIVIIKDSIITADICESRFVNCMGKLREYNVKNIVFIGGVLI
jgi:hypothetical protein